MRIVVCIVHLILQSMGESSFQQSVT